MKIIFDNVNFFQKRLIRKIFTKTLLLTQNDVDNLVVGVKFVSKSEIQKLNKEFRNLDKVTDVLSFPLTEIKEPHKLSEFDKDRDFDGSLYIGDIAVCCDVARVQAKEFGNTYKRELSFLALHGFLHILGYDHIEKNDEIIMMNMAERVLQELNIKRG